MAQESIDTYLAACVRACLGSAPLPAWPWNGEEDLDQLASGRIKFHGIALLLAQHPSALPGWPARVAATTKDEARMQALWEASHRSALVRLLKALDSAGIRSAAMKGTALAYGFHADPATRRRGDTDLLVPGVRRSAARHILAQCGFTPSGDRALTQEPWSIAARDGFEHQVDIHWRINGSASVSKALERLDCERRIVALPRLDPCALSLGPVDNLILTCVNRYAHRTFGYHVEDDRPTDGDRLIWAVDIKLVTDGFTTGDWAQLADLAAKSGTASVVQSALAFAEEGVGIVLPEGFREGLARAPGGDAVAAYLGEASSAKRFISELGAVKGFREFALFVSLWLLPGKSLLTERFPDAQGWPLWALRVRRLASAFLKQLGLAT